MMKCNIACGTKRTDKLVYQLSVCLLCTVLAVSIHDVSANFNSISSQEEEICSDKDIRNNVTNFSKLMNCTVIEGFLQILLIDKADSKDYENISFPKLREITGFFLLYRVAGLKSLRNLFPNLSVIRGTKLFHNYGFIIYEMMALEEVGLPSLTHVLRGSVRISRNPHLCYVNTIDWDLIAVSGAGGHVIKQNRESNECPEQCPTQLNCPVRLGKSLCWNQQQCQKVCDSKCGNLSCSTPNLCCSAECLGGCSGRSSTDCFVCSGVKFQEKCSKSCPPSTFKYADRRCLTDSECFKLPKEVWDGNSVREVQWKTFDHQCLPECPTGYMEDETDVHACKKCVGTCPKVCSGIVVDSVATAQMLRGCTRISGFLEIGISGGKNVVRELEENLNMIEEVDEYVKIVRSSPLVSLNFLRNLKKINGSNNEKTNYSLLVYGNPNLEELFDLKQRTHKLEIVSGKMFFHLNPKLCVKKIKELRNYLGLPDWDERDISSLTNGDRISCDESNMKAFVVKVTANSALVRWENFQIKFSDHRTLLGYLVAYREAPHKNLSIFDGRDGCSSNTWREDDVAASDDNSVTYETYMVQNLKPFKQYVIYIRTYTTVGTENVGARSKLLYFKTLPDSPSIPMDLKAISSSPFEITLTWLPPLRPNGNVTHYVIIGHLERDVQERLDSRNYCKEHFVTTPQHEQKPTVNKTDEASKVGLQAQCESSKEKVDIENAAKEAEFENQFEDTMHNHVYMKNEKYVNDNSDSDVYERKKRSIDNESVNEHKLSLIASSVTANSTTTASPTWSTSTMKTKVLDAGVFYAISNTSTKTVKSLKHFSKYVIEIQACHDADVNGKKLCSSEAIATVRTARLPDADVINYKSIRVKVENGTLCTAYIRWDEPKDPNGVIVTFEIEYKRVNIENYKPVLECITHRQYTEDKGYNITSLAPGSYSLRLRATSLAGFGNWTAPVTFVIPDMADSINPGTIAAIATSVVLVIVVLVAGSIWIILKRKYARGIASSILYASVNPEYISTGDVYVPDEWEVPREKITILEELGQGSFGMVYSGIAKDIVKGQGQVKCAIKTVNETATVRERIEFLNEASVMKAFTSYHVLRLMGVVSKGQPTLVVMELMAKGDLKAYLRSMRPDAENSHNNSREPPTLNNILRMASEIADGMAYLAAKKFVHRDLAARNCMVAEDLTVKIGDFGMTRDVYETDYYRKGGKGLLPVRWMAPESLKDGVFTSLSDAWSFGIVLWEMATLASQPYQGLSNEQVLKYVIDGGVMERPEACPNKLYDLMRKCWYQNPKLRPTFMDLVKTLLPHTRPSFTTESFYYSEEAERLTGNVIDVDYISPATPLWTPNDVTEEMDDEDEDDGDDDENKREMNRLSRFQEKDNDDLSVVKVSPNDDCKALSSEGSNESKLSTQSLNGGLINGHFHIPNANISNC